MPLFQRQASDGRWVLPCLANESISLLEFQQIFSRRVFSCCHGLLISKRVHTNSADFFFYPIELGLNPFSAQETELLLLALYQGVFRKNGRKLKKHSGDQAFHLKCSSFESNYKVVGCKVCNHELRK